MYFCMVNDVVLFVMTKIYYCMTCKIIGKILGGATSIILVIVTFSRNRCKPSYCERQCLGEGGSSCSCVMGGDLVEGGDEKVIYVGMSRKCTMVKRRWGWRRC